MKKILNLLLVAVMVIGCQQSAYQNSGNLPKQVEIAVLLPIKEQQAQKMDKLIAAGLQNGAARNININTYEVSDEQNLAQAMQKVLANKTDIILGPVTSGLTKAVAEVAQKNSIPVLSLSNDPTIADNGVYVFGHSPLQQSKKLFKHLKSAGVGNIIFLLPDSRQTVNLSNALRDIAATDEITVVGLQKYLDSKQSIDQALDNVAMAVSKLNEDAANFTKPAIYLADESEKLRIIFDGLVSRNLDKLAIVCGENKIDIDYTEPIDLVFTGAINKHLEQKALKQAGVNYLSFLDKLAYDLGLMTSNAIGEENFNKKFFLHRLASLTEYGLSGATRIVDFAAQRNYEIIKRSGVSYNSVK